MELACGQYSEIIPITFIFSGIKRLVVFWWSEQMRVSPSVLFSSEDNGNAKVTHFKSCSESLSPFAVRQYRSLSTHPFNSSALGKSIVLCHRNYCLPRVLMDGNYWPPRSLLDRTDQRDGHINATEFHTNAVRNKNQIYSQRREGRHNMFPLYPLLKRYIYPRIEDFIWISEIFPV